MKITTADQLLEHMLKDIYSAEEQLVEALPKMAEASTSSALKESFKMHLEETRSHIARLEEVANVLNIELGGMKCHGMQGLIEEGEEVIKNIEKGELLDGALVGGARKVEHYEILGYGMIIMMLEPDDDDLAEVLKMTLNEEEATDKKLTNMITT